MEYYLVYISNFISIDVENCYLILYINKNNCVIHLMYKLNSKILIL